MMDIVKNKNGEMIIGCLDDVAIPKDAEAEKASAPAEEKPVKKTTRKTVKK